MIIDIGNRKIKINNNILVEIYHSRQLNQRDCEAGGMLIGSIIRDSNDIIIEDLTMPIKGDINSRTRYVRSEKHNKLLEQKWIDSQYTKMYFGEWHTHPQDIPFVSLQDIRNWMNLMKESKTETNLLVFLIAGNTVYKVWIGNRIKKSIHQIYEGDYSDFTIS
ncbi:integrative and conjugative element protein, VC0181 family [Caloranaerobacter azorensis DSM 13643]|uniref:Integrative and conjugative element protein, VC0181 family n=1 Tax=Caloranaerobacter azorensis DSM 13643 TaxID=1121264 RepID=A0A1M5VNY1_9FIRM|nr:Mov34/MPN/PAD-1 family protein [Caloranaerobacter azorensis]SHH76949.1 integrative and conjugative element protein, VC0181 family [Caloranaerobacter azorensis DSM 13643]